MQKLIDKGQLGNKSDKGLYMREKNAEGRTVVKVYNIAKDEYEAAPQLDLSFKKQAAAFIQEANYRGYADHLKNAPGADADLVRYFIGRYISYSLSLVPDVTDVAGADGAMGFGFNWVPASAWIDLLGGVDETKRFIEKTGLAVPDHMKSLSGKSVYSLKGKLDFRQLFRAS